MEVKSTQDRLKEQLAAVSLDHGYFIVAEAQTAGRGRGGNQWDSSPGNLYASIWWKELPFSEITWIPHWVSVCVLNALVEMGADSARLNLKWPNDIWVDRSLKACGIICEKKSEGVVIGIGVNLKHAPATLGASVIPSSREIEPLKLLEKILEQLSQPCTLDNLKKTYEQHSLFKAGDVISWKDEKTQETHQGRVRGLGDFGELLVGLNDGTVIALYSETVNRVRIER